MNRTDRTYRTYDLAPVTVGMVAVGIVVWFGTALRDWLIFDRVAILRGQIWRVVTGEFVHLSVSHLVCDVAVVALVGMVLERRLRWRYALLCFIASVVIGAGLMMFEPEVRFYGGLSGLAMCLVVVLGIEWLREGGRWRGMGLLVLAGVGLKLVVESGTSDAMFVDLGSGVVRSSTAHWVGALVGLLWGVVTARWNVVIHELGPIGRIGPI